MDDIRHQDGIHPFPAGMQSREVETNGAKIHVRVGGHGPAVVMLHGFGTTGDMWGHLASALIEDHMVVAPDLRGLGLSSKPDGGYDKKNQAADVVGVMDALGVRTAELVTHDIGIMVGFAVAATHRERVSRWVAIDAPLPGVGPWEQITQDPAMWHFGFGGQDMERLAAGRERIYLDRFWNDLSRDPKRFDEAKRQHYAALYAQPGAMRAGFAQFRAFSQDAADNRTFLAQGKLEIPVLAFGGDATFGPLIGAVLRCVADDVEDAVIPDCGHWITEEQPQATTDLVVDFLGRARRQAVPAFEADVRSGASRAGVADYCERTPIGRWPGDSEATAGHRSPRPPGLTAATTRSATAVRQVPRPPRCNAPPAASSKPPRASARTLSANSTAPTANAKTPS